MARKEECAKRERGSERNDGKKGEIDLSTTRILFDPSCSPLLANERKSPIDRISVFTSMHLRELVAYRALNHREKGEEFTHVSTRTNFKRFSRQRKLRQNVQSTFGRTTSQARWTNDRAREAYAGSAWSPAREREAKGINLFGQEKWKKSRQ